MRNAAAACLAGLLLLGQAIAGEPTPEERYDAARKVLKTDCGDLCDLGLDNDPAEVKALDALRDATQDWTLAFLTSRPGITIGTLKTKLAIHHPDEFKAARIAPTRVTLLAPDLYAFSAYWGVTGNVFLVGRRNGQWAVVWDVRKAETARFAALKAWRSDHAGAGCYDEEGHDGRYDCGPLYGAAFALKPDAQGRVRFGLGATYAQGAGFTVKSQISFWRWDGTTAEPLLAETYSHEEDDIARSRDSADTVVVRVKDAFKSFYSHGGNGVGRQLDWSFRILPDRIADEGTKPLYPELDAVDDVLDHVLNQKPATDLASLVALKSLRKILGPAPHDGQEIDRAVQRTSSGAQVCLATDGLAATHFVLTRRGNGFFVQSVRLEGRGTCTQPAAK